MERRCGSCHGGPPNTKPPIGTGLYFQFGEGGPPLPLVHDLMDLKRLRSAAGYFKFGRSRTPQSLCNLTRREQEVLELMAEGNDTNEIASTLSISTHTVRNHVQNVLFKLQVNSRLKAINLSRRLGMI